MAIGVANGILRVETYGLHMSALAAHQLSTFTGVVFSGVAVWLLWRRRPLDTARKAWLVGATWLAATVLFEFSFGRLVVGHSWSTLLADYNVLRGRVWLLFLVWVLVLPAICYRVTQHRNNDVD